MLTNDLRERLADAFQREVDLDVLGRTGSRRGEMGSLAAYGLADVALGVVRTKILAPIKAAKTVAALERIVGHEFSCERRAVLMSVIEDTIVDRQVRLALYAATVEGDAAVQYDSAVDDCPECEAKPGEHCIMERAVMTGYPDPTPLCPRDQH